MSRPAVTRIAVAVILLASVLQSSGCSDIHSQLPYPPQGHAQLTLVEQYANPVLTVNSPGAEHVTYGFEDGRVIKIGRAYHLVITEFIENPLDPAAKFTRSNIAHWASLDRIHWQRIGTLIASTGDRSGTDTRSLCGGYPVYGEEQQRWNLFFSCTRSQPDSAPYPPEPGKSDYNPFLFPVGPAFSRNQHIYYEYSARSFRAVSDVVGINGIGGPYEGSQTVLETGANSQPWEGLWGVGSFEPYQVGAEWFAFYGSSHSEGTMDSPYSGRAMVGLASAPDFNGPWKRLESGNPLNIEKWLENPIVSLLPDGEFIAVYNAPWWPTCCSQIGYTTSSDGIHWSEGKRLTVQPQGWGHWADVVRTPLGLVPERDGTFSLFYTGTNGGDPWAPGYHMAVGFVTVRIE